MPIKQTSTNDQSRLVGLIRKNLGKRCGIWLFDKNLVADTETAICIIFASAQWTINHDVLQNDLADMLPHYINRGLSHKTVHIV